MNRTRGVLLCGLMLLAGCTEDSAIPGESDEAEEKKPSTESVEKSDLPSKPMIESSEFESLEAFLDDDGAGFVILHQERASGSEDREGADTSTAKLTERFNHFRDDLVTRLGEPDKQASEWDLGIPTFASGNGYALWNTEETFVSLFVNWDNPEDPSFVIVARAPLSAFDSTPGASNPWKSKWMEKGQW